MSLSLGAMKHWPSGGCVVVVGVFNGKSGGGWGRFRLQSFGWERNRGEEKERGSRRIVAARQHTLGGPGAFEQGMIAAQNQNNCASS